MTLVWKCALTRHSDGQYNESEELFMQVMETRKRVPGEEHPSALTSMANLAHTWKSQGRSEEAISLMEECSKVQKQILGPYHLNRETSLRALNEWRLEKVEIRT